jgi:hypothetical protein
VTANKTERPRTDEHGPIDVDGGNDLLDLKEFAIWCAEALSLESAPLPELRLREDLSLDLYRIFELVTRFDELTHGEGVIEPRIYSEVDTIRDLYLYYLQVMSMPKE